MNLKSKPSLCYLGGGLIILVYLLITAKHRGDLFIYESASKDMFQVFDIYSRTYVDGFHYFYSVLFAIIIYPFTLLPQYLGNLLWLIINAVLLIRIIIIISKSFDVTIFSQKQKIIFAALALIFALRFLLSNFLYQQITICILYLAIEGLRLIFSGNKLAGALLIALGINIKILPIVLLPYLLYRREFKASFFIMVFYAIMLYIPVLFIGSGQNNFLLASWWRLINPTNSIHNLDVDERSFHSLSTLLATLLVQNVPDKFAMHVRRNIMDISYEHFVIVLNSVRLALISFALYFFRTWPFKSISNITHRYVEISYLLLLIPLIFPHQQDYAFLFIIPAITYIIYYLMTNRNTMTVAKFRTLTVFMVFSYLLCNLSFIFGQFRDYYEHFKILTYGALIIIPLLAICYPLKNTLSKS